MTRISILFIVLLCASVASAQETLRWESTYPDDVVHFLGKGYAIARDAAGNVYAAGYYDNGTDNDVVVLKFTSAGALDTSFSDDGVFLYDDGAEEEGYAIAVDADEGVCVVGKTTGGTDDILVLKLTSDGLLDDSFSVDGVLTYDDGDADVGYGIAVDETGVYVVGTSNNGVDDDLVAIKYTLTGALDASFSADGIDRYDGGNGDDEGRAIVVQTDGTVFVAGMTTTLVDRDILLIKYLDDGTPDITFDVDGILAYDGGNYESANALCIDGFGNIYLAGVSNFLGIVIDALVVKLDSDGVPVAAFNGTGAQTYDGGGGYDDAGNGIVVDSSGNLYVSITSNDPNPPFSSSASLLKYTPLGALSAGFDGDGVLPPTGAVEGNGVLLDGSGNPVFVGRGEISVYSLEFVVLRKYTSAGVLSLRLSDVGFVWLRDVAVDDDGNVYAVGDTWNGTDPDVIVMKYDSAGALDATFGDGGVQTYDGGLEEGATAVAVDGSGNVYVVGWQDSIGLAGDILILKFTSDGDLDTSFSGDGVRLYDVGNDDYGRDIAVDGDGNVYVTGSADSNLVVLKYTSAGAPDGSFDGDGVQTYDDGNDDSGEGIALDGDGNVVVVGSTDNGSDYDIVILRYLPTGQADLSFNTVGSRIYDEGSDELGSAVLIDGAGNIVVAGQVDNGLDGDIALLRCTSAGALDSTFSGDGIVTFDSGSGKSEYVGGLAVDVFGNLYLSGGTSEITNSSLKDGDSLILKYTFAGVPDTGFDGDGLVAFDSGVGQDMGMGLSRGGSFYLAEVRMGTMASVIKYGGPPLAPSAIDATALSSYRIDLTWTDNSNDEDGFRIERSYNGESYVEIATVGAGVTSYTNRSLDASFVVYHRVRAYNEYGASGYSDAATAETFPGEHKSRGFCYIATAAEGAGSSGVRSLERFRDRYLRGNAAGVGFVACYERLAPRPASIVATDKGLRGVVSAFLQPVIVGASAPGLVALLAAGLLLTGIRRLSRR